MKPFSYKLAIAALAAVLTLAGKPLFASSHQDAPLAVLDPAANTTDVYAFVDQEKSEPKSLVVALGVYPFEEPGIGPNKFNFDDNVLYEIHVAQGRDLAAGRATLSYQFEFRSQTQNPNTILQNFTGVIQKVDANQVDPNQNFVQRYTVTKVDHRWNRRTVLGTGIVPPNNQGNATPFYNQGNNGENPAKPGVSREVDLDPYTRAAIATLGNGYRSFAGQRDDGFYADIQSIFDLLKLRNPGKDSQGGFNIHLMALEIPVNELGGDQQVVGVYASTSRRQVRVLLDHTSGRDSEINLGRWVQVARQGNPLFCEALVAVVDKDLYSRTSPERDNVLFRKYAETPELAKLIGSQFQMNRTDIVGIFIPDLIKVDLSTPGAHLTNTTGDDPQRMFSRLSIFGGDLLKSKIQDPFRNGGLIPGGWPNGRRFGDDVVDIAIDALLSDLRVVPPVIRTLPQGDGVSANDMVYNSVFPYESTPQNGRIHGHHGLLPQ